MLDLIQSPLKRFPVSEIYGPVLQGEGPVVGRATHFVRFGYCDGAGEEGWCAWCDSLFSVDPINKSNWRSLTVPEIYAELVKLPAVPYITLSGGNPAIHNLAELCRLLHYRMPWARIIVETQATIWRLWISDEVDDIVLSPKPPSAGSPWTARREEVLRKYIEARPFDRYSQTKTIKIAVDPERSDDLTFAAEIGTRFTHDFNERHTALVPHVALYLSCVTPLGATRVDLCDRYRMLMEAVLDRPQLRNAVVLAQQHYFAYGDERGK